MIRQFLCDRIEDAAGLKETAQGLIALERMSRFTPEDAIQVATTLVETHSLIMNVSDEFSGFLRTLRIC